LKVITIVVAKQFDTNHNWQLGKKKATLFGFAITRFFGSTIFFKDGDET
jgi:hypothetical protein